MNNQVRILQVIGSLEHGGSQSMIMQLYRNINREKMQFDFIINEKDGAFYKEEIEKMGGKVYFLPRYKVYNHYNYVKAWKKFFSEHPTYKIVHGHVRSTASIYLNIAKKNGLITIAHSHSISSGKGLSAIVKNILQLRIRYVADYFLGCSQEANRWLFGKKIANSKKCMILRNGVELNKFAFNNNMRKEMRDELGVKDNEILIGHVGRFEKVKNHKFLIKIFNEYYSNEDKNVKLLLIGDGTLKEKIVKEIKKIGIEKQVIFKEKITDIQNYYNAMDIFIFPSLFEGLGIVLIEAQLSGLKCIISKRIPEEAIISMNVKRINNFNSTEWNEALKTEIKKRKNREILDANSKMKEYDIKCISNQMEKFYMNLNQNTIR